MSTDTRPESAPLASNPAPAVDVLRRLVETWEAKAEDTIGENVLALGPLMVEGRQALDVAARHATPELNVDRLIAATRVVDQRIVEADPQHAVELTGEEAERGRRDWCEAIAAAYAQAGDAVEAEREATDATEREEQGR